MFNLHTKIARKLAHAGITCTVRYAQGCITVEAECDVSARDALGFEFFIGYIDGVEVTII